MVYDFGVKRTILRKLRDEGLKVTVVPSDTSAATVLGMQPDGIFLSNGPGDPGAMTAVIAELRTLLAECGSTPVFGICLGHQLLALALGARTYKLKFGHHGGNHPVRSEADGSVAITAQNHGFAVDLDSLGDRIRCTHVNLFDQTLAGLEVVGRAISSVQYHPEASPGPHDSGSFFAQFMAQIRDAARS